jgi:hypothetical protein
MKVYEFSKHVGALCARAGKNVHDLGPSVGVLPSELLDMINGRKKPTKAVIAGLARELNSDVRYLEKLAEQIKKP